VGELTVDSLHPSSVAGCFHIQYTIFVSGTFWYPVPGAMNIYRQMSIKVMHFWMER